jgi:uncharacterized membrane protein
MSGFSAARLFHRRWRLLLAAGLGLAGSAAANGLGAFAALASLIGWNLACIVYLSTTGWMMLHDDEATVRARARREDEGSAIMTALVLCAVAASLAATVLAIAESKATDTHLAGARPWSLALSASTLVLSWIVVQCVFALRYAHRYFGDSKGSGSINRGIEFPGDPPRSYRDFIYMAVCVGATSQVSDFNITSNRFRNLVTLHAVLAFAFNTTVLALGINMLASLIGQ